MLTVDEFNAACDKILSEASNDPMKALAFFDLDYPPEALPKIKCCHNPIECEYRQNCANCMNGICP